MKKIDLPIGETHSISVKLSDISPPSPGNPTTIGVLDVAKNNSELAQAKLNGGMVIWATTHIEHQLERIITAYLFGDTVLNGPIPERDFFINNILRSSFLSYNSKRELVMKIVEKLQLLGNTKADNPQRKKTAKKELNTFGKLLRGMMTYRNAFAHGELVYDNPTGCILKFYSTKHRSYILHDDFWEKLEAEYKELSNFLQKLQQLLREKKLKA